MHHTAGKSILYGLIAALLVLPGFPAGVRSAALSSASPAAFPIPEEEKEAPLSEDQALGMLQAGVPSSRVEAFARKDGIDFKMTPELEQEFRKAGATAGLIQSLKKLSPATARPETPATSTESSALLHQADDALERKNYAEAVKALQSIVALQSDLAPAWYDLGFAYTGLNQPDEAISAYQKCVALDPNNFLAQLNLGVLLLEQKQPEIALQHLEQASKLKPEDSRARLNYGRALAVGGQTEAAKKEYQEAARLDPHLAMASLELGQLELQQKDPQDALASFQAALQIDPTLAQAELGEALACEDLNDEGGAIAHFEKYLEANPSDLRARLQLGRADVKTKEYAKARGVFEELYRQKPDLPGLTAELGDVNALVKNYPDAEKFYRLAVNANPADAGLHRALGQVLLNQHKYGDAEKEFRTALQADPHNREATIGLALSLNYEKRYEEAIPLLEQLATSPDATPTTFFVLATCYDHLRQQKPALANYERFLSVANGKFPDQEWQATQRAKLLRRELGK